MADKFKLENLEQLDADSILSSDQMLVQRLVENDNAESYRIEISTLLGTVASQVSSIVSSSLSDYVLSSSLSDYETIANAQSSYISAVLSTDLSDDIALGTQKLPTGNAINQYVNSIPWKYQSPYLSAIQLCSIYSGAIFPIKYVTQTAGWYHFSAQSMSKTNMYVNITLNNDNVLRSSSYQTTAFHYTLYIPVDVTCRYSVTSVDTLGQQYFLNSSLYLYTY